MAVTERGKVQHGGIVFQRPVALPDGTEVVVHIEPVAVEKPSGGTRVPRSLAA